MSPIYFHGKTDTDDVKGLVVLEVPVKRVRCEGNRGSDRCSNPEGQQNVIERIAY